MIRRVFLALLAAGGIAAVAQAQDGKDVLVIDVDGSVTGTIEIQLLPDVAPKHVERIETLARDGAYDNVVFHRVIDGFMAQTGDVRFGTKAAFPQGQAGTGGSDLPDLRRSFRTCPSRRAPSAWRAPPIPTRPIASSSSCSRLRRTSTVSIPWWER